MAEILEGDFKTEEEFHSALRKERDDFFRDLSVHSDLALLNRMSVAVSDEIHGEPGEKNYSPGVSHRLRDQGGLVWELKRRLESLKIKEVSNVESRSVGNAEGRTEQTE